MPLRRPVNETTPDRHVVPAVRKRTGGSRGGYIVLAFCGLVSGISEAAGPVVWDPPSIDVFPEHEAVLSGKLPLDEFIADGRRLFIAKFNIVDGAGRPMATGDSKPTI